MKIKPILTIQGEKLDKYGTSRTMKKARKMMIDQVKQDISDRGWGDDYEVACVYSYDKEAALDYLEQVKEAFPDKEVIFDRLSLSVACHIGPGSLAVAAFKKVLIKMFDRTSFFNFCLYSLTTLIIHFFYIIILMNDCTFLRKRWIVIYVSR